MILTYTTPHRLNKLHDELLAALPALRPDRESGYAGAGVTGDGTTLVIEVPDDTDEQAVNAVVVAHDASTPGIEETAGVTERTLDERLEQQLPILRTAIAAITASPPTLFAGLSNQERVFLRRLARNQADLIKLRLRDLESTD
jgi:hypothetical protein